eukprot:jgi/Chlat1/3904/Chrsp26S04020
MAALATPNMAACVDKLCVVASAASSCSPCRCVRTPARSSSAAAAASASQITRQSVKRSSTSLASAGSKRAVFQVRAAAPASAVEHDSSQDDRLQREQAFRQAVKADIQALRELRQKNAFDTVPHIGAEQEVFLVNEDMRPALVADELLAELQDNSYAHEVPKFVIEHNLPPQLLSPKFLTELESGLSSALSKLGKAARRIGVQPLLIGSLPTLRNSDLEADSMSDASRYIQLTEHMRDIRGEDFQVDVPSDSETLNEGLHMQNRSAPLLIAATCSFQLHMQIEASRFEEMYNLSQAIAGPIVAAGCNSPVLFGKTVWHESRVPYWQQCVDMQVNGSKSTQEFFGRYWLGKENTFIDILSQDAEERHVILTKDDLPGVADGSYDPYWESQEAPKLGALCTHNSTMWRWNRPCYGVGKDEAGRKSPHLRIEQRLTAAGPTIVDEIANAALFFGLMLGYQSEAASIPDKMSFDDAKRNLFAAAEHGLHAELVWFDGRTASAADLLLQELIPRAEQGLKSAGVATEDVQRYLGIIQGRCQTRQTGSQWLLDSLDVNAVRDQELRRITKEMLRLQNSGQPVHTWPVAK